jgi:hypothetical protein
MQQEKDGSMGGGWLVVASLVAMMAMAGVPSCATSSSSGGDSSSGSSGSAGTQPACGTMCMGNYACGTEAQSVCGDPDPFNLPHCQSDSECQGGGPGYCYGCETGVSICKATCTDDTTCNAWESCTAGRCTPLACTSDASCPANFACSAAKTCARMSCESDADCAGSCVLHACQAEPGYCVCTGC